MLSFGAPQFLIVLIQPYRLLMELPSTGKSISTFVHVYSFSNLERCHLSLFLNEKGMLGVWIGKFCPDFKKCK